MSDTKWTTFPFDLFRQQGFPGEMGPLIQRVKPVSMFPPYPWGQWFYGTLLHKRCVSLPGDIIEAGVGHGGMSVFFALLAKQLGVDKEVIGVDSFEGLPDPDVRKDNVYFVEGEYGPGRDDIDLLESFRVTAAGYGVGDMIVPVKGFFDEALPKLDPELRFCFAHIDGDIFESVYTALEGLYERVVEGGVLVIDDFFHPGQGPLRAAAEFFNERGLTPLYHVAFPYSVALIKGEEHSRHPRSVDGNSYAFDLLRRDNFFRQAVERSLERAESDRRKNVNCSILLDLIRSDGCRPWDIYDYWRALEEFWEWADVTPDERRPKLCRHVLDHWHRTKASTTAT